MVTILGGGIAGTVLGGALARDGHPVTVYERRPDAAATGAFLVLDGAAHTTLTGLGVSRDALEAVSYPMPDGFAFHYLPAGEKNTAPSHGHRLYPRAALMDVLTGYARAADTDIRYGHTVTGVSIDYAPASRGITAVTLHGPDGIVTTDTLIIAADGIDSVARAHLEPGRRAEYAGQVVLYGTTTGPLDLPTAPGVMHFHGRLGEDVFPLASFGHLSTEDRVYWFTRLTRDPIPVDDIGTHPIGDWAEQILTADPTAGDLIGTILDATDTVHVSNCRNVPVKEPRQAAPPLILCGDADHAITPAAVRGAREAIEDAAALHAALTTGEDPAHAMTMRRIRLVTERARQARIYSRATGTTPTPHKPETSTPPDDFGDFGDGDPTTRMWLT